MDRREINKGNKLIAKFMDFIELDCKFYCKFNFIETTTFPALMSFNKSWDWIMPVVERIQLLGFNIEISNNYVHIYDISTYSEITEDVESIYLSLSPDIPLILNLYEGIVTFIKWFNKK